MKHIVVLMIVLLAAGKVLAATEHARMDSLFRKASAQVGHVPAEISIKAFEEVLKLDWKFAPAHYEIAKLYMSLDTPMDRQSARNALNIAIRLDSANVTFQMKLAKLLGKQGFWYNSARKYEDISNSHPENAEAAFMAEYYAVRDFEKYIDMQYVDTVEPIFAGGPITSHLFYWRQFGEKDRTKAIDHLEHSIKIV